MLGWYICIYIYIYLYPHDLQYNDSATSSGDVWYPPVINNTTDGAGFFRREPVHFFEGVLLNARTLLTLWVAIARLELPDVLNLQILLYFCISAWYVPNLGLGSCVPSPRGGSYVPNSCVSICLPNPRVGSYVPNLRVDLEDCVCCNFSDVAMIGPCVWLDASLLLAVGCDV